MPLTTEQFKAQLAADEAERAARPNEDRPLDYDDPVFDNVGVPHRTLRARKDDTPLD